MRKLLLAALLPCLFLMSSAATAATGDDIMSGIPTPPNAKSLARREPSYSTGLIENWARVSPIEILGVVKKPAARDDKAHAARNPDNWHHYRGGAPPSTA